MYEKSCLVADSMLIVSFCNYYQDIDSIREKFARHLEKLDKLSDNKDLSGKIKEKVVIAKEKISNYIFLLEKIEKNIVNYAAELENDHQKIKTDLNPS